MSGVFPAERRLTPAAVPEHPALAGRHQVNSPPVLFPTAAFALFFVVAFVANWLLRPHHSEWRLVMTGLSLFFYGYWDARFVWLLVASIAGNWVAGYVVAVNRTPGGLRPAGRWAVRAAVAANLALLGVFKYYGFFVTSAANLLNDLGLGANPPLLAVILPVGISFFTFQAISYVVDVGRGDVEPLPLLDFAFYLSFFPQLVAGPIVRASTMADQIRFRPDPRTIPVGEGLFLIGQGLFKKVVISSYLADRIVDPVFEAPGAHSGTEALVATYAYAVQIYADFSGYTDIAIGCALLLGFRFPRNFDSPYVSRSVQEFWRRWHITLSSWLRDYLYIPLGGSRDGTRATYRNLSLTMLLGGLWHGAAWNFVVWGGIHGGALAGERYAKGRWPARRPVPPVARSVGQWLVTFHVICVAWVFFRAPDAGRAFDLLGRMVLDRSPSPLIDPLLLAVIGGALAVQFLPRRRTERVQEGFARLPAAAQVGTAGLALVAVDVLGPAGVAPFIYFQF
jgi:alginate O-acetyltransferase complex protein AlgI